jgi:hypothetical protein
MKTLSFVVDRETAGLPAAMGKKQSRLCFWHVAPTGDYLADTDTGNRLALEYLEADDASRRPALQWIVADMPRREMSGIEVGFLSVILRAASADKTAGRRDMEQRIAGAVWYELQTILVKHGRRRRRQTAARDRE